MLTLEHALEVTRALRTALERLEVNDYDGDETPHIEEIEDALARMYALPGVLPVIEAEDARLMQILNQAMKGLQS